MPAGPVNQLSLAVDATGQVIAAVDATQWAGSTPCTEWTVSDVVRHLVAGNFGFAKAVDGNPRPGFDVAALADADLLAAFRDSGAALVEAFGQPGALERIVAVPVGQVPGAVALHLRITEILVHGWDVATATGQQAEFPDDLAEAELTFSRGMLDKLPPGRIPFAPPQSVAQDAPAIQRLVACLGRNVGAVAHLCQTRQARCAKMVL